MPRMVKIRLKWCWEDVLLTGRRAARQYADHRCTQIAAGISYYVFFSIFPLTIFVVTVLGQLLRDDDIKADVVDTILEVLPLAPVDGHDQLTNILNGVSTNLSLLGLISVIGLIWSSSAMLTAIRLGLNAAWDVPHQQPALLGKLIDFGMLLALGLLIVASVAMTGLRHYVRELLAVPLTELEPVEVAFHGLLWVATLLAPILISFGIFCALYRWAPAVRTSFADVWPGALAAALAFELAKVGFTFYVRNITNYNALYGSLGAIVVSLLFIYIASNVLLLGAEVAAEWPKVRAGHYDHGLPPRAPAGPATATLRGRAALLLRQSLHGPEQTGAQVAGAEDAARAQLRADTIARRQARLRAAESAVLQRRTDD